MIRSKLGLLVLCLVVFDALAFSASATQAETGARLLVLGTENGVILTDAELEANKEKFEGSIENATMSLLTKVLGIKVAILCTAGQVIDALMAANASVKNGAKTKFTGCVALKAGTTEKLSGCSPHSVGQTEKSGIVETNSGHILFELHELTSGVKDDIALVLPDNKEEIVNILMGEECAVGEQLPVFGKLSMWDCSEEGRGILKHAKTHLITEFKPSTKLYVISDTAEHLETSIDGSWLYVDVFNRSWGVKLN